MRTGDESGAAAGLLALADALVPLSFGLSGDEAGVLRARRDRLVEELDGHRARIRDLDAPLLVVLGGVTGAGKSTIVNTLVGRVVARTGVRRPTTSSPTLVVRDADAHWFTGDRVLAGLPRLEQADGTPPPEGDATVLRLVRDDGLPAGLALLDAPDIDSVRTANRDLADLLLDAADLWLWATTAGKYADEESMRYLRRARERDTALAVALTRVAARDAREVAEDFRAKLDAEGLATASGDLFVVEETTVEGERLPDLAVAGLRDWLTSLADPAVRRARRRQTLDGALAALPAAVAPLRAAAEDELRVAASLVTDADRAYARARDDFGAAVDQGLPLQQEVLGRWDHFVGTGRFLRLAEQAGGQARGWIRQLSASTTTAEEQRLGRQVRVEVADTLVDLVRQVADLAAAETADAWSRSAAGRDLVAADPDLGSASGEIGAEAERAVAAWQEHVVTLVETKGADRRTQARWISSVVNAGATGAIVVSLAHTGGLTGAEVGIAGGAAAAQQALLVRLLGAQNLRWLVGQSRADLVARFARLAEAERERFSAAVAAAAPDPAVLDTLDEAAAGVVPAGQDEATADIVAGRSDEAATGTVPAGANEAAAGVVPSRSSEAGPTWR